MILLLDTSTSTCRLWLVQGDMMRAFEWEAGRELAKGLLEFIVTTLDKEQVAVKDLEGIGVRRGPGSFTGLRIGITTLNTIAASEHIPIVGAVGDNWTEEVLRRLHGGENDRIVLPEYGRDARITTPRK